MRACADPVQPPPQHLYGPTADISPEDLKIVQNRDPDMGVPVGKGDPSVPPILLAKLSKGQEIELVCKAYKASRVIRLYGPLAGLVSRLKLTRTGDREVSCQMVPFVCCGIRV
jgi:hypothetical protein